MPDDHFYSRISSSLGARGLRLVGKLNVPLYRLSRGRIGARVGQAPVLLLITTGRRSGEPRTAPLVYLAEGESMVLIDTNAGNERLPGWSRNLSAEPEAEVEIAGRRTPVRARVATGAERTELWRRANLNFAGFDDYIRKLQRTPSVWVLEPR